MAALLVYRHHTLGDVNKGKENKTKLQIQQKGQQNTETLSKRFSYVNVNIGSHWCMQSTHVHLLEAWNNQLQNKIENRSGCIHVDDRTSQSTFQL